jgi:hypothetical protein
LLTALEGVGRWIFPRKSGEGQHPEMPIIDKGGAVSAGRTPICGWKGRLK